MGLASKIFKEGKDRREKNKTKKIPKIHLINTKFRITA